MCIYFFTGEFYILIKDYQKYICAKNPNLKTRGPFDDHPTAYVLEITFLGDL